MNNRWKQKHKTMQMYKEFQRKKYIASIFLRAIEEDFKYYMLNYDKSKKVIEIGMSKRPVKTINT